MIHGRIARLAVFAAVPLLLVSAASRAAPSTRSVAASPEDVLRNLFAAVEGEDRPAFERLTTSDFRAFEGGSVFDRRDFFARVEAAHRGGKHFRWEITDPRLSQERRLAVVDYINKGTISEGGRMQAMSWLEVVSFRRGAAGWQVCFVSSQRVAT